MTGSGTITREVIHEVQQAIHDASRQYFVWSKGRILYEAAEILMQVCSAERLFDIFSERHEVMVHLERPIAEWTCRCDLRIQQRPTLCDRI